MRRRDHERQLIGVHDDRTEQGFLRVERELRQNPPHAAAPESPIAATQRTQDGDLDHGMQPRKIAQQPAGKYNAVNSFAAMTSWPR